MRFLRNAGTAVLAAALLAGCGDSNDPAEFDPAGMTTDIQSIAGVLDDDIANAYLTLNFEMSQAIHGTPLVRMSAASIRAAGELRPTGSAAAEMFAPVRTMLPARTIGTGLASVVIADELLGTTYEWNAGTESYEATAATGAPADGVRFVLYAVDPASGDVVLPLITVGHVDMIDVSTATSDGVRILVLSSGTTYMDYRAIVTPSAAGDRIVVDGFVSDGDERLTFDLTTTLGDGGDLALDYDLDLENRGVTMDYTVTFTGDAVSLDFEVAGPNGALSFSGGGSGTFESYIFEVNGDEFATLTFDGETTTAVSADGDPLTPAESMVLQTAYNSTFIGYLVAIALMMPAFGMAL